FSRRDLVLFTTDFGAKGNVQRSRQCIQFERAIEIGVGDDLTERQRAGIEHGLVGRDRWTQRNVEGVADCEVEAVVAVLGAQIPAPLIPRTTHASGSREISGAGIRAPSTAT